MRHFLTKLSQWFSPSFGKNSSCPSLFKDGRQSPDSYCGNNSFSLGKIVSPIFLGLFGTLVGCASVPESIVQIPTTARPQQPAASVSANGAIFQASTYRPLFEDRRARLVGDILTIAINEKTSAGKAAASSGSKSGSTNVTIPTVVGLPIKTLQGTALNSSAANKFEEKDAGSASNNFSGTISVTVVEVLTNGNLVVSGEKQVALDKGAEFIRFSGVVSPDSITGGNIVSSTLVADARVEYRTNSRIDKAEVMGLLARFFFSFLPI
jgi:flagellar L-ring protein FlgH